MTPHRIVQHTLRSVAVAAAAVVIAGCAASPPAETSPEPSRPPAQIERTDPPEYRHVPQGTYKRSTPARQASERERDGDGDATRTLPVTPPEIDLPDQDQDEAEDDSSESGE